MPATSEAEPSASDSTATLAADVLRDVSLRFGEFGERFEQAGAVGLVVVGAPMLSEIERRHGEDARVRCLESRPARVLAVAEERLRSDFAVCAAEPGYDEVIVLLFRKPGSAGFFRTEMPVSVRRSMKSR